MKKLDGVKRIIEQFALLPYKENTAGFVRVGSYQIKHVDQHTWSLKGLNLKEYFSTRMAAMGYARCLQTDNMLMANQIKRLDEQVGASRTHLKSIANAVDDNNDPIVAKKQEAEIRHREHMQSLAKLLLGILD